MLIQKKRWRWFVLLALLAAITFDFVDWWASLGYALHTTVCDPSAPQNECNGYNPLFAFAMTWAVKFNYWGPLVTAIATGFIAWFTFSLRDATIEQGKLTERADKHFQVTERAYVKMSHLAPGIEWNAPTGGGLHMAVRIKNFGHTPAEVTDVFLTFSVLPENQTLPAEPDYTLDGERGHPAAFLVTEDEFVHYAAFTLTPTDRSRVEGGTSQLFIFGHVDYIDKFGSRHRGGYGRVYDREVDQAALIR